MRNAEIGRRRQRAGLWLVLMLAVAACARIEVAPVPQRASAAGQGEDLAPIQLDRVVFNLQRGQVIGAYRDNNFQLCGNSMLPTPIHWVAGKLTARDEELLDTFYREMTRAHYNVVGDPDALFGNYADAQRDVEFLVAGRIDSITLDVCDETGWNGRPRGTQRGEASVDVTWQVFSPLEEKVVLETQTSGSGELADGMPDGEVALILRAFAAAAHNLAGDPRFHDALIRKNKSQQVATNAAPLSGWGDVPAQPLLALPATTKFSTPIGVNMSRIQASVVTISTGTALGSGFFVAPNLVMTNHHVARDAARLKLTLINGTEVYATTLRSDTKRDVALLQVEGGDFSPLPLRLSPVAVTEEVYAVGSPLYESLAGTVTRGIVSQLQHNEHGLPLIQADATIQPGSSGGPLLDSQGNVIGISQSGLTDDTDHLVGINFFIPIADALQRINLQVQ